MMTVYRAPIQTEEVVPGQQEDTRPRTRCGYLVPEAYSCYETALGETGAVASGKALHFAADIICSGGIDIWIRGAYSYAVQHISLANPRIFVYLRQRIQELDAHALRLPEESFYSNPDVQNTIGEVVLVLQLCPKRTKLVWPRVDPNTKRQGWLRGVAGAPETRATRLVWTSDGDTPPLYLVANELCKAIAEGGSESALFWIKWVLEEDGRVRKETKGHGLSTKERGPATLLPKQRSDAGHFVAELLGIIYKEFAAQNLLRMHEEFGELMRLWRNGEKRMAVRLRRDCLGLMCLIVCEVPRWKVPAAPSLISDPVRLSRAVGQTASFFNEVLAHKALSAARQLKPTMTKGRKANTKAAGVATEKEKKALSLEEHFDAYDAAMEAYLNRA
jgi:hypothetical protein